MMSVKPPKILMGIFIWSVYGTIWCLILYGIEYFGAFEDWSFEHWSGFQWAALISIMITSSLAIAIGMQYLLDYWYTDWKARLKKRASKHLRKQAIKQRAEEDINGTDFQVD